MQKNVSLRCYLKFQVEIPSVILELGDFCSKKRSENYIFGNHSKIEPWKQKGGQKHER